jgi:hypothetical protein
MDFEASLSEVFLEPAPLALWQLRSELVVGGFSEQDPVMVVLDNFYNFLNELVASSTAREYSHFASLLDIAAVGGVVLESLIGEKDSEDLWMRLMLGAVSEAMMVLAARQYVKAWEQEMEASYNSAVWYLSQEYWKLSVLLRPELAPEVRQALIKDLIESIQADNVAGTVKAGVIVRLFQLLLFARLRLGGLMIGD